jgi:hypothetical protein
MVSVLVMVAEKVVGMVAVAIATQRVIQIANIVKTMCDVRLSVGVKLTSDGITKRAVRPSTLSLLCAQV